mmetsp:Transcript_177497/g.569250  ORF Transcript_177497/g.569250 Transcript_177497/m.569250 type:complete len:330 (+) Transcript_177497:189-1178(+)
MRFSAKPSSKGSSAPSGINRASHVASLRLSLPAAGVAALLHYLQWGKWGLFLHPPAHCKRHTRLWDAFRDPDISRGPLRWSFGTPIVLVLARRRPVCWDPPRPPHEGIDRVTVSLPNASRVVAASSDVQRFHLQKRLPHEHLVDGSVQDAVLIFAHTPRAGGQVPLMHQHHRVPHALQLDALAVDLGGIQPPRARVGVAQRHVPSPEPLVGELIPRRVHDASDHCGLIAEPGPVALELRQEDLWCRLHDHAHDRLQISHVLLLPPPFSILFAVVHIPRIRQAESAQADRAIDATHLATRQSLEESAKSAEASRHINVPPRNASTRSPHD